MNADSPYAVEAYQETTSTGHLLDAHRLSGPRFPGLVGFGSEGGTRLGTLAKRMNLAYAAGASAAMRTCLPADVARQNPETIPAGGVQPWKVGSAVDPRFDSAPDP